MFSMHLVIYTFSTFCIIVNEEKYNLNCTVASVFCTKTGSPLNDTGAETDKSSLTAILPHPLTKCPCPDVKTIFKL